MAQATMQAVLARWPDESREAAQLVVDTYGEPDEVTPSMMVWHRVGPWKRVIATRAFDAHEFPAPHHDCVESVIDYAVPPAKAGEVVEFDGSVIVHRTAGEVAARCHDEQANFLALNLMHDIVTGARSVREARDYYAKEFADYRRKRRTPYMERLRFAVHGDTRDSDTRALTDADLEQAVEEGKQRQEVSHAGPG
jgi:hypothetical protein